MRAVTDLDQQREKIFRKEGEGSTERQLLGRGGGSVDERGRQCGEVPGDGEVEVKQAGLRARDDLVDPFSCV